MVCEMKTPILFAALSYGLVQFSAASILQATNRGPYDHELFNIAPAPTAVPRELELKARALGLRQASGSSAAAASTYSSGAFTKTCGYYDGVLSNPFTCDSPDDPDTDYECAYNNDKNYFGCCPVSAGAFVLSDCPNVNNPYTSCVPYESASTCTDACFYGNRVCDATYPYCGKGLLTTGSNTYTAYYCNSAQADVVWTIQATAMFSAYASSSTSSSRSSSSTSRSATSSSSRASSSSSSLTSPTANNGVVSSTSNTSPSKGSTGTAAGQSSTGTASPTPKKPNVGAIAGGVVGGVVGLALIIGGIAYMLHRKKANERRQSRLEISQVQ